MSLRATLDVRTTTGIALTPAMQLGLEVMRLGPLDLLDRLRSEAESNPMLIFHEPRAMLPPSGFLGYAGPEPAAAPPSLADHASHQIAMMALDRDVTALARYLAADLDERGYLVRSLEEIALETDQPLARAEAAHQALKACDPPGIGATDLADCLALQLEQFGLLRAEAEAVVHVLPTLLSGDAAAAARALDVSTDRAAKLAEFARRLDPNPCGNLAGLEAAPLVPELRVHRDTDGSHSIALVDDWLPSVTIDQAVYDVTARDPAARAFAEGRLRAAETLARAVDFRGRTLLRIGQSGSPPSGPHRKRHPVLPS